MAAINFANPQLFQNYQQDPATAYAQGLIQQGSSTAPVQSWGEGLARALQAGVGGAVAANTRHGYQDQDAKYRAGLAAALKGDDIGASLSASDDPTLQGMGLQYSLSAAQAKQKAQIDAQSKIATEQALNPVLAQRAGLTAEATAPIDIATATAKARALLPIATQQALGIAQGQAGIDIAKAQAMLPIEVQKAIGIAQGTAPIQTAQAVAQAQALSPIQTQTAANTAQATAPIDVQKAVATAAGVAPIEKAKAESVYNDTQGVQNQKTNIDKLADDYRSDPNIKSYQIVAPILQSMKQEAGTNTRAADLNLVYGMAKIMDPGSVVREGEQVLVNNTASLPNWLVGQINALNGGQALQPTTRKALLQQAESRVGTLKGVYDNAQKFYSDSAVRLGGKPDQVFYDIPAVSQSPEQKALFDKYPYLSGGQ